jgi:hypothetical protein
MKPSQSVVVTRHDHLQDGEEDMPSFRRTTMASRAYDKAHSVHYATKDLHEALELYQGVLAAHPNTQEAGYSRTQMHNIVKGVVPKDDLMTAQVDLALARLEHEGPPDNEQIPLTPVETELPS